MKLEQGDNTRYGCKGDVEFVGENTEVRTFAKLTDISLGGCYVQMTANSAPGTEVHLAVEVKCSGALRRPCFDEKYGAALDHLKSSLKPKIGTVTC